MTNKQLFEAGKRFQVETGGKWYMLCHDQNGSEFLAVLESGAWVFAANIALVTADHCYIYQPTEHPTKFRFDKLIFQ